jgi:hypothetical protein
MIKEVVQESSLVPDVILLSILSVVLAVSIFFDSKVSENNRTKKYRRKRIVNWIVLAFIKGTQYMSVVSVNFLAYTYKGRRFISFDEIEFDFLIVFLFLSMALFSFIFGPILNYVKIRRVLSLTLSIQCLSTFIFGTIIFKYQKSTFAYFSLYLFYIITSISYVINELILMKVVALWYTKNRERAVIVALLIIGEGFKSSFGWSLNQYEFSTYLGIYWFINQLNRCHKFNLHMCSDSTCSNFIFFFHSNQTKTQGHS